MMMMMDEDDIDGTRQDHWISIRKFELIMKERSKSKSFSNRTMMGYGYALIDPVFDASLIPAHDRSETKGADLIRYRLNLSQSLIASAGPKDDADLTRFLSIIYKTRTKVVLNLVCTTQGDEASKLPANYGEKTLAAGYRSKNVTSIMLFDDDRESSASSRDIYRLNVQSEYIEYSGDLTRIGLIMVIERADASDSSRFEWLDEHRFDYLHYGAWVDNAVIPPDQMNMLIELVQDLSHMTDTVLVHCWSGIGRTGTFMTNSLIHCWLENQLELIKANASVVSAPSIDDFIYWLRQYRQNMVYTAGQYLSIYDYVQWYGEYMGGDIQAKAALMIADGDQPVERALDQKLRQQRTSRVKSRLADVSPMADPWLNTAQAYPDGGARRTLFPTTTPTQSSIAQSRPDGYTINDQALFMYRSRAEPSSPTSAQRGSSSSTRPNVEPRQVQRPRPNFGPRVLDMSSPLTFSSTPKQTPSSSQGQQAFVGRDATPSSISSTTYQSTPKRTPSRRDQRSGGASRRQMPLVSRFDSYDQVRPASPTSSPTQRLARIGSILTGRRWMDGTPESSDVSTDLMSSQSFNLDESVYSQQTPISLDQSTTMDDALDVTSPYDQPSRTTVTMTPKTRAMDEALQSMQLGHDRHSTRSRAVGMTRPVLKTPPRF